MTTSTAWTTEDLRHLDIPNVSAQEMDTIRDLLKVWQDRLEMNVRRSVYYAGEKAIERFLVDRSVASKMRLGWTTMAVRKPAVRSQFDGLKLAGSDDPLGLSEVLMRNRFDLEFSQAVHASGQHGMALVTVTGGYAGEAPAQIHAHSAEHSSAIWDARRRGVYAALTIGAYKDQRPSSLTIYFPGVTIWATRDGSRWSAERIQTGIDGATAVAVPTDPQLDRPLGRSRITRPVMDLSDIMARGFLRMESNAEVYSSPLVVLEGVDADSFETPAAALAFKLAQDRALALTKDEDGASPTVKQLQQATMTPHSEMLRTFAGQFSGETGIPVSALGIIHDQPASAEAIRAAEHDLLIDVTYHNRVVFSRAVEDIARLAWQTINPRQALPAEAWKIEALFTDPEFRSTSGKADAALKLAAHPLLADSTVTLEGLFDQDTIKRITDERRRSAGASLVDRLLSQPVESVNPRASLTDDDTA